VRVERSSSSRSLRLAVAVSDGPRFRVEVLGAVGAARLALVFDGTSLRAALPTERLCGEWRDTGAALGELTGIALPAPQWLALLLGRLTPGDLETYALQVDEVREGRVVRARLPHDGSGGAADSATVTYDGFRRAPGGVLAAQVHIRHGAQGVTLSLRQLRPLPPPAEALALLCPPGFRTAGADAFAAAGVSFLEAEE
jgi:hypothetical protein